VGAYGQEVSASIVSVTVYDLAQRRTLTLSSAQCGFSYRTSIFNTDARGRYIILQVTYDLIPNAPPKLAYADLQRHFAGSGTQPTLKQVREAVRSIRSSKGMVISPGDPDSRSAGSFFKNPVLTAAQFREVVNRAAKHNLEVPNYPGLSEQHKISAAWLVENSGFFKGYVQGRAGISSKHALAIVNRGGASASDIIGLAEEIRARVESTWGILLQVEPVFVGDRAQS
jgi:UDP-N-acetylmuramate dehydrogenase